MNQRLILTGVACVALLGLCRAQQPAQEQPTEGTGRLPASPRTNGGIRERKGIELPPEPPLPDRPPIEFPREPLASFGESRLRHKSTIDSLAFQSDGKVLAVAVRLDPTIYLWDTITGREIRRITIPGVAVCSDVIMSQAAYGPQVEVIDFTPDGKQLVLKRGPDVLVYDPKTGEKKVEIAGAARWHIALSPDGRTLTGLGTTGRFSLWSTDTGRLTRDLGEVPPITGCGGVCFSPDGKSVAAFVRTDRTGRVVIASVDGSIEATTRFTVLPPTSLTVRDNYGRWLHWPRVNRLIFAWNDTYIVIDPTTGKEIAQKPFGEKDGGYIFQLYPTADGRLLAPRCQVIALDLDTLARTPLPGVTHPGQYEWPPLAVTADGKTIAVPNRHSIGLCDLATGKFKHPELATAPASPATKLGFTLDRRQVIAAGYDGIRIWDPKTGKARALSLPHPKDPWFVPTVLPSPDGKWLAGADINAWGQLAVWDAVTGAVVYREPMQPDADGLRNYVNKDGTGVLGFDRNGTLLVFHQKSGDILRLELPSGRIVETIAGFPNMLAGCLSHDARLVAVSGYTSLAVRDLAPKAEWRVIESRPGAQPINSVQPCATPLGFTPDGRRLVTQENFGGLAVWDTSGKPVLLVRRERNPAESSVKPYCSFTLDGRRLFWPGFFGDDRFGIRILETATLEEEFRLVPPSGWSRYALSPDNQRLVLAHADTTFTVWDWPTILSGARKPIAKLPASPEECWARLGNSNPKIGLACLDALVANPDAAVTLLKAQIHSPSPARVKALIADLGNPEFRERERAERELIALGWEVTDSIREATKSDDPEIRLRAGTILSRLKPLSPVQIIRTIEVLERIGSTGARELLQNCTKANGLLGSEANAALDRLKKSRP